MRIKTIHPHEATGLLKREYDATQVIAYFNYINRLADALDVEPDEWLEEFEKELNVRIC